MRLKAHYEFIKIKNIPRLFWSSPRALTPKPPFISVIFLIIGLTLFGIGEAFLIASGLGVSPWTVLAQGITNVTGFSIGVATFFVSCFVLICWIPLKQIPGIGTIFNVIIIALVLEFLLPYLPTFENILLKFIEAALGVLITGFGGGLYLIANLGPGPRDGLMTGLQNLTNFPIAHVRGTIEIGATLLGWIFGGTVGVGTVLFALGIGPSVAASMYSLAHIFKSND